MIQFDKFDEKNQRPIQRCDPILIKNIVRINRFESNNCFSDNTDKFKFNVIEEININNKWECKATFDNLTNEKFKELYKIHFNVFSEYPCTVEIEEGLCSFENNFNIDISLDIMKYLLKDEISSLGKNPNLELSKLQYISAIEQITKYLISNPIKHK